VSTTAGQRTPGPRAPRTLGDVARFLAELLRRFRWSATLLLAGETAYLFWTHQPGARAFGSIAAGSGLVLSLWPRGAVGLPVVPMLALQHLLVYGLPIVTRNATLAEYPQGDLDQAGWEVFAFSLSLGASWFLSMQVFTPSQGASHALDRPGQDSGRRLSAAGFALVALVTASALLDSLNLTDFIYAALPTGSTSLVAAALSAAGMVGFFLLAQALGAGRLSPPQRLSLWVLLVLNCAVSASSFLLSGPIVLIAAVAFGLFWGNGRFPWRYLGIVLAVVVFLSASKYTMRQRYWVRGEDGEYPGTTFALGDLPGVYAEWASAGVAALVGGGPPANGAAPAEAKEGEGILGRINNLQNLLYVIRIVETEHVTLIHGATYALVPELLVPRILWPEKPRSHVGQEILNVHFGRQDRISTFSTYVAWGLLPEAYGNFGRLAGALALGAVLGLVFAWVENYTANKLILSLEGLLAFALMVAMANSFEMVSTVLVTSTVDSLLPIGVALLPFVHRTTVRQARLSR
jgi:hypothetical protein